ncbi:MAG TPA: hypothetical protein VE127_12165 [Solirubrobacteraceae bacterium]|nr:hypothetical protein [Solirubrobacteraceae bacterium]
MAALDDVAEELVALLDDVAALAIAAPPPARAPVAASVTSSGLIREDKYFTSWGESVLAATILAPRRNRV